MTKHRLQFDFSEEGLKKQLDTLKDAIGANTRAELIRQALRLLRWTLMETQENKATILVEKNGSQREVVFPFMTNPGQATSEGYPKEETLVGQT